MKADTVDSVDPSVYGATDILHSNLGRPGRTIAHMEQPCSLGCVDPSAYGAIWRGRMMNERRAGRPDGTLARTGQTAKRSTTWADPSAYRATVCRPVGIPVCV